MPEISRVATVAAPPELVAGVLRDTAAATEALSRIGCVFRSPVRLLVAGDEVEVGLPGGVITCRTRITRAGMAGLWSELAAGPAADLRHVTSVVADGSVAPAGSLPSVASMSPAGSVVPGGRTSRVVDELGWTGPLGPLGRVADPVLRRFARRLLDARGEVLDEWVARLSGAPVVVGAAIVRDGRLLVACRAYPPELAGRWELPGGGVEAGEREPDALRRECSEELGADVEVVGRVGTDLPIGTPDRPRVLRIHGARLRPGSAEPVAREHRELRWVGPGELAALGWLDADRAVVTELRALLAAAPADPR
ncbi:NUDIX domain-containing protein [Pseudonocardia endophytica]|uniref:8-oxo-dGTP diphosphatase n=1 Tax=Pseudonocardia endophytica TaxID=401976 RepID=A0A4R1I233_PSEEN|nr:NUDIX domain-containing protein [Pseudonocardia endophytica]TCK26539.1 8-oxo-dGTP diphosphatase [Pseudonocardia endophytica]